MFTFYQPGFLFFTLAHRTKSQGFFPQKLLKLGQNTCPLCFCPSQMSSSSDNLAVFRHSWYRASFLCNPVWVSSFWMQQQQQLKDRLHSVIFTLWPLCREPRFCTIPWILSQYFTLQMLKDKKSFLQFWIGKYSFLTDQWFSHGIRYKAVNRDPSFCHERQKEELEMIFTGIDNTLYCYVKK